MRNLVIGFLMVVSLSHCGEVVESVVAEDVLVDTTLTLNRGTYLSYPFTVDFSFMDEPRIFAGFSSDQGTTLVQILVLTEGNFALWEQGEPYSAAVESPLLAGTSFDWNAPVNGTYRVVLSNRGDTQNDKQVAVFAFLQWLPAD